MLLKLYNNNHYCILKLVVDMRIYFSNNQPKIINASGLDYFLLEYFFSRTTVDQLTRSKFHSFFFLHNLVFYDFYGCYSKVVNLYCMFYNAMIGTSEPHHRIRISGSMRQYTCIKTSVEFLDSLMEQYIFQTVSGVHKIH